MSSCRAHIRLQQIARAAKPYSKPFAAVSVATVAAPALAAFAFLKRDEQLLIETPSDRTVRNGPGPVMFVPLISKVTKRKAHLLTETAYVVVTDTLTGTQRTEAGPRLFFPGAYEVISEEKQQLVLEEDEYVKLLDEKSGDIRVVKGPMVFAPSPTEQAFEGKRKAMSLKLQEFVRLTDSSTGTTRVERGEQLVIPGAKEHFEEKQCVFQLQKDEYIRLLDTATGMIRVEIGEQTVCPSSTEVVEGQGVQRAIHIDDETAALVVSKLTSQQSLVTDGGPFFPGPHDQILEVRKLIRVEPHEVAIVRDRSGAYHFHRGEGCDKGTAFFLPPHCELVTMYWGSGSSQKDLQSGVVNNTKNVSFKVPVTKIDTRSQYAFFEFNVRTSDKVELVLEGTIFWQVIDVEKMIHNTGDPKGDVWYHVRSALIQAVSRVTLEELMAGLQFIVAEARTSDEEFYLQRGCLVHGLEVIRFSCLDPETNRILQELIQETTNRINRMQKQNSDNEVQQAQLAGETEVEKQRAALIKAKAENDLKLASVDGEAAGLRLAQQTIAFFNGLGATALDADARIELLKFFEQQRAAIEQTDALAKGNAHLFLTPEAFNLKLQAMDGRAKKARS